MKLARLLPLGIFSLIGSSFSLAETTVSAGWLYVPSGDLKFSGAPGIDGTEIDDGNAIFANIRHDLSSSWNLGVEVIWYQSETKAQPIIPEIGPIEATLELEGWLGFVTGGFRIDQAAGWDSVLFEIGGGIGYASIENTVTARLGPLSAKNSDTDGEVAWQVFADLGYQFTDAFSLGAAVRYIGIGDLRWEDETRNVEAENIHTLSFGAFAAFSF